MSPQHVVVLDEPYESAVGALVALLMAPRSAAPRTAVLDLERGGQEVVVELLGQFMADAIAKAAQLNQVDYVDAIAKVAVVLRSECAGRATDDR